MSIKVFEAFAGVGMTKMALDLLAKDYELDFKYQGISEIDKHPVASYEAIHGECNNYGDIQKVQAIDLPDIDLLTYSFPCQDVSTAGKGKGIKEGTRSGLLFEIERIVKKLFKLDRLPRFLFLENVEGLLSEKHIDGFYRWRDFLSALGYENSIHLLNANNYGIPQSRNRVFMISELNGEYYYEPRKKKLNLFLKDILCDFDEKYFLKQEFVDRFKYLQIGNNIVGTTRKDGKAMQGSVLNTNTYASCLSASEAKRPQKVLIQGGYVDKNSQGCRVYEDNMSTTLSANGGGMGAKTGLYLIRENTKQGYVKAQVGDGIVLDNPKSKTKRGRIQKQQAPTLMTSGQVGVIQYGKYEGMAIKKLSPRECWRLMGIHDEMYFKAASVNSATQLYKQAGNGIVVNVLYELFYKMFVKNENENDQLQLF